MTGETIEKVGHYRYQCTECDAYGPTRSVLHDRDCPVIQEVGR